MVASFAVSALGRRLQIAFVGTVILVGCGDASAPGGTVAIVQGPAQLRQGEVGVFAAAGTDAGGNEIDPARIAWSSPDGLALAGRFVPYTVGTARVIARIGGAADTMEVAVTPRGLPVGNFALIGRGVVADRYTTDLWVHGTAAYTGTLTGAPDRDPGNTLYVWDVADPAAPQMTDSVSIQAGRVNDVKVRSDGALAVITHEPSSLGGGITLLDLQDPLHPAVMTRFTGGLTSGVHNVWVEGDYVYAAVDGGAPGLVVVDISDPTAPFQAGGYYGGSSFVHDVYVRDGLAFVSHWDFGLVILDVGNGIRGGSPAAPALVSRVDAGGETHNAWYWPAGGYVFVGEEDFGGPEIGSMHVVDVSDLGAPREVASFEITGDSPPHNFWMDESREVLYLAWYSAGVRALDVSGELFGELHRQGREISANVYDGARTLTWAPQLHEGLIYLSDINSGLWVLNPDF